MVSQGLKEQQQQMREDWPQYCGVACPASTGQGNFRPVAFLVVHATHNDHSTTIILIKTEKKYFLKEHNITCSF